MLQEILNEVRDMNKGHYSMLPFAGSTGLVVVTGTGANLDFPDVVVSGIEVSKNAIKRADATLVVGGTFDTSASENQIKIGTTDAIYVKKSSDDWPVAISAIPVPALSFQTKASDYGAGGVIPGNTDIKDILFDEVNGTYNFRTDETNFTKAIEATGGDLELLTVLIIMRIWWARDVLRAATG